MNKKLSILFTLVLMFGIVRAETPRWVEDYTHPKYPQSIYFLGVGIGEDRAQAEENARADLLKQIKVNIKSELITEEMEIREGDKSYLKSKVESKTESTVQASVSGLKIAETVESEGQYYALSVLNKSNFTESLKNEMEQIITDTQNLIEKARNNIQEGDIYSAFENYKEAQNIIPEFYIKNNLLTAISGEEYQYEEQISASKILSEMRSIVSKIDLELIGGDQQTASTGSYLPDPVKVRVIYKDENEKVGVDNFPVVASYKNGEEIDSKRTDKEGTAEFRIKAIATDRSKEGIAEINLTSNTIPNNLKDILTRSKVQVSYNISTPDLKFALDISGNKGENLSGVTKKLEQIITENGYEIDEKADLIIEGEEQVIDQREISSAFGDQYMIEVEIRLKLIRKKEDKTLASLSFTGKGLSKESKSDAIKKARQRVNVNKQKFLGFLKKG